MRHCAGTYVLRVKEGKAYLYSVRRDGRRVATAFIWNNGEQVHLGHVVGPGNRSVEREVVVAVRRWLRQATNA